MDRRPARTAALALAALALTLSATLAAQSPPAKISPPEGWVEVDAHGRLAAIKHPETLARAEAARLQVSAEELPSWRADLIDRLGRGGLKVTDDPTPIDLGGKKALKTTLAQTALGRDFMVLLIEVQVGDHLIHVTAFLRPDEDHPADGLEADVLAFAAAAAR